ncbi:MAG: hypothetical protein ACP5GY_00085 [Vulcanisaeta sp.]
MRSKYMIRGQARIMEAIAATIIILILAMLMPILFKSPVTTLRSEVQVGEEQYAYNVLYDVYVNPQFLNYIYYSNWSALKQLMDTTVGPQFNWFLCIEPLSKVLNITSSSSSSYVAVPIQVIVTGAGYYDELALNIRELNWLLPPGYQINTTLPLSNVFFTTDSGSPVYWWVQSYNPYTGNVVIWFYAKSSRLIMYVSRNGTYPYNPLTGQYCAQPYCGYGGLSMFEIRSLGTQTLYNDGSSVFNEYYYGFNEQNTVCSNAQVNDPLVLSTSSGNSASCTLSASQTINEPIIIGYTSKLESAIPGSTLSIGTSLSISVTSDGIGIFSTNVPLTIQYSYGQNSETIKLSVGSSTPTSFTLNQYIYLSGGLVKIMPMVLACQGGFEIAINASLYIHDYLTGSNYVLNNSYVTECIQAQLSEVTISMQLGNIVLFQTSPSISYILYNTTNIFYDLWVSPLPSTFFVNPVYVNYECAYNLVPTQYRYRFPTLQFTPTAEAYTLVQLQNGSYYLVLIALQSLGGG